MRLFRKGVWSRSLCKQCFVALWQWLVLSDCDSASGCSATFCVGRAILQRDTITNCVVGYFSFMWNLCDLFGLGSALCYYIEVFFPQERVEHSSNSERLSSWTIHFAILYLLATFGFGCSLTRVVHITPVLVGFLQVLDLGKILQLSNNFSEVSSLSSIYIQDVLFFYSLHFVSNLSYRLLLAQFCT